MKQVAFTQMKYGSREEYLFLHEMESQYLRALPERMLSALERLGDSIQGYQVSRLTHSLQTAGRAEDDGADLEYVVAALLHDIGDELAPENHSQLAAAVIRPYVRAEVAWVVEMHGLFQMKYYAHHYGKDRDAYLAYREHPWFDACVRFCERWDQGSFDPAYPTRPLSHYEPMLREVLGREPFNPATLQEPKSSQGQTMRPTPPITGIAHVGIRVFSLERSRAFYEKLGFRFVAGPLGSEPVAIMSHPSGIEINFILNAPDADAPNVLMDVPEKHPGYTHIALSVRDLTATQAALQAAGVNLSGGPITFPTGAKAVFRSEEHTSELQSQ